VDHLAALATGGGCVYLVDVDVTAMRFFPIDPALAELQERYTLFHKKRGNDLSVGLRLGDLLGRAGLSVERFACRARVFKSPPGMRPPSWAARAQMVADGVATEDDFERWGQALEASEANPERPWIFPATFVAVGRKP
ncbi:MAG: SAM-dependent methyltransferase, partial [Acidimicrobiales bacterium]